MRLKDEITLVYLKYKDSAGAHRGHVYVNPDLDQIVGRRNRYGDENGDILVRVYSLGFHYRHFGILRRKAKRKLKSQGIKFIKRLERRDEDVSKAFYHTSFVNEAKLRTERYAIEYEDGL